MKFLLTTILICGTGVLSLAQNKGGTDLQPQKSGTAEIYDFAEVSPEFPGGEDSLVSWINAHIKVPADKRKDGKIYVRFEVLKNGKAVNPQIIKGLGPEIDKEILRVLEQMPLWKPGTVKGKVVIVRVVVPIEIRK